MQVSKPSDEEFLQEPLMIKEISMKKYILVLTLLAFSSFAVAAETFDFVIETSQTNETFAFWVNNAENFVINWGDGTPVTELPDTSGLQSHIYADVGRYTNQVSGTATRIAFGGNVGTTPRLLRDIISRLSDGVTGITSADSMFSGAANITQFTKADWFDAASSNVTSIATMFMSTPFNQDVSGWNMGKVTSMMCAFRNARAFNQNIGNWNVSKVGTMFEMFRDAKAFNQDIGNWDVGKVQIMFQGATAFEQDISRWNVSNVGSFGSFLKDTRLPTDIYNQLLIQWSRLPLKSGVVFDGGGSTYDDGLPAERKQHIISTFGWTFTDGGSSGKPYPLPDTVLIIR